MGTLLISLLTLVLLLISAFIVLIILMQRTSQSGGMGAALGGGAAESAFGAETNNILTKGTIYGIIAFFVIALSLYLLFQAEHSKIAATLDPATLIIPAEEEAAETTTSVIPEESVVPAIDEGTVSSFAESVEATVETLETEATEALAEEVPASE
ncbi:MAG: preprotein translocase subunit SecG [Verrucomicrobiota bacterium]